MWFDRRRHILAADEVTVVGEQIRPDEKRERRDGAGGEIYDDGPKSIIRAVDPNCVPNGTPNGTPGVTPPAAAPAPQPQGQQQQQQIISPLKPPAHDALQELIGHGLDGHALNGNGNGFNGNGLQRSSLSIFATRETGAVRSAPVRANGAEITFAGARAPNQVSSPLRFGQKVTY